MKNRHSPCGKNCPDRWVSETSRCHSTCPKWAEYVADGDKERKNKLDDIKLNEDVNAVLKGRKRR